jgi:hypothetical protein
VDEAEWLACEDVHVLLGHLRDCGAARKKQGRRRLQLFGCACCRLRWDAMDDPRSREAVEYVESVADGRERDQPVDSVRAAALEASHAADRRLRDAVANGTARWRGPRAEPPCLEQDALDAAQAAYALVNDDRPLNIAYADPIVLSYVGEGDPEAHRVWRAGMRVLADLARCIFGNPFRPVALDPGWRTEAVVGLAAGVYADRAFDRLPVLADALEDAGCADPGVLGHCRSGGPHARGCWVVDLILGKE